MQIIEISAARPQNIAIGRCTENGVTQVRIDLSEITQKHPDLTRFEVLIKNPLGVTYPAVTERNESTLIWNVTAADTATAGKGFYEIAAYGANGEKKLAPYAAFVISGSLDGHRTETPPDPAKGYVEKVLSAAAAAEEAAKRAEEAADKAESGGTVNPDSPGGEITPGAIKEAVAEYLTENPPPAGPEGPEGPQGPAGQQGPEGKQGPQGESGVHVGADMPPNGEDVWIDPNGDPWQLPVASADTLGGVKVGNGLQMDGEVLGVAPEGVYELIEKITLKEPTRVVFVNTEPDGKEYNFQSLMVKTFLDSTEISYSESACVIFTDGSYDGEIVRVNAKGLVNSDKLTNTSIVMPLYGRWFAFSLGSLKFDSVDTTITNNQFQNGRYSINDFRSIKGVKTMLSNSNMPSGTEIEIWGVRKNA